jgi:uncharacterized protein (DUF2249 family)
MTTATLNDTLLIDVRTIAPPQRHPLIFGTFDLLAPGEAFEIVNDHDPLPLYFQFERLHLGEFEWNYLETGPSRWHVRIERVAAGARAADPATDTSGCCGHCQCSSQ